MTPTDLATVLHLHALWLANDPGGKRANLTSADLAGADLADAVLADADLAYAKLTGANMTRANLAGANMTGATLTRATMPDGRVWEAYRADHLAGICTTPEVRDRAAAAWGSHQWTNCPMHAALGVDGLDGVTDAELRCNVAAWVALYDSGRLDCPGGAT